MAAPAHEPAARPAAGALKAVYERPYVVIFSAAVALSAHGLFTAAAQLGRIPPWLAWLYVLIVDLLAVAAYRTWRQAAETGSRHWAWVVAAGAAVGTVAMNTLSGYPELAPVWVGPAIAGFPPLAALLATALRLEEHRLRLARPAADEAGAEHEPAPATKPKEPAPAAPVSAPAPTRRLAALPATTLTPDETVAALVTAHLAVGGRASDPALTAAVAAELGVSARTARRRLQPFREQVAA